MHKKYGSQTCETWHRRCHMSPSLLWLGWGPHLERFKMRVRAAIWIVAVTCHKKWHHNGRRRVINGVVSPLTKEKQIFRVCLSKCNKFVSHGNLKGRATWHDAHAFPSWFTVRIDIFRERHNGGCYKIVLTFRSGSLYFKQIWILRIQMLTMYFKPL